MLRDALCLLASQQASTGKHRSVQTLTLNPKSISLGELFGEYNAVTSEWRDGVASVLIRGAVSDEGPGHKLSWIVFDGPVDAVWVENMNTVGLFRPPSGCADGYAAGLSGRAAQGQQPSPAAWAFVHLSQAKLICSLCNWVRCTGLSFATASFSRQISLQVLDDNCLLCLPNGERLKLNAGTMRILFEVGDLTQASPATVSRCGMVYMPPSDLGWQPYIR